MENFGSEIGQKMRSAVKAKLLELGTGGSTGYIDDELPDYVMIMVANKRSKQQMIADLNLFLGSQTELFVTWLHEVLQKLQEVTLPAANATTKKRKSSQREDTSNKKDKKSNKKEKKTNKKTNEETTTATTAELDALEKPTTTTAAATATSTVPVISSITDVFADVLLEKAKKTQDVTIDALANIKKGKGSKAAQEEAVTASPQTSKETTNEFNIPTISEISSTTGSGAAPGENRKKDLAELAEIQKKIYAAKKHLKKLGEINDENEDDDFINIKDDGMESMDEDEAELNEEENAQQVAVNRKAKSPIVFDAHGINKDDSSDEQDHEQLLSKPRRLTPPPLFSAAVKSRSEQQQQQQRRNDNNFHGSEEESPHPVRRSRERERSDRRDLQSSESSKRPVHERLGMKLAQTRETQRERRVRQEKELYVPAFRRKEMESEREREMERQRDRDSGGERERERGDRSRGRERERDRGDKARQRETRHRRSSPSITAPPLPHSTAQRSISSTRNSGASAERMRHIPGGGGSMDVTVERKRSSSNDVERGATSSSHVQRQRIGSRVIIAPVKQTEPSDEEEEKPVNSVIKIKPRPPMSPGKQACKNLLLRAVAEAQRSTIFAKNKAKEPSITTTTTTTKKVSMRLGEIVKEDSKSKLYTKSYRDRLKRSTIATSAPSSSSLFRRATQNLVIEVEGGKFAVRRQRPRRGKKAHLIEAGQYVPQPITDSTDSDDYVYIPEVMENESIEEAQSDVSVNYEKHQVEDMEADVDDKEQIVSEAKTQFVVTLNDEKAPLKYKKRTAAANVHSRSGSPLPQVSSSSSASRYNGTEATSTTHPNNNNKSNSSSRSHGSSGGGRSDLRSRTDIKSRLLMRPASNVSVSSPASTATATRSHERESSNSSPSTPPPPRRTEFIEIYRKPKEIKKIIIKADSEDEESPKKGSPENTQRRHKRHSSDADDEVDAGAVKEERSTTPPLPPTTTSTTKRRSLDEEKVASVVKAAHISTALKRKHTPIKFDFDKSSREHERAEESDKRAAAKRRSKSGDRADRSGDRGGVGQRDPSLERRNGDERRKISIRNTEAKKYDNIPSLSSVALDSSSMKQLIKPKERCKYHPNCTKQFCDYYHPTAPCKAFPNCKFADKCMYSHPKCKYDMACTNIDCNFSHSGTRNSSLLQPTAPPLSSHVVPVQNYKSISAATPVSATGTTMCKYYPGCTKVGCTFYHPKPCRFGKNCINKLECNFYHHEVQSSSKFKWVASIV